MFMRKSDPHLIQKRARKGGEFAVPAHQLTAARQPGSSIHSVVNGHETVFPGRPYSVWRDDPEIAREINDGLADRRKG